MLDDLLERFRHHDRRALSRLLSMAARDESADDIAARLPTPKQRSRVVAFTGSAGVGKSTLVGKMIEVVRGVNTPPPLAGEGRVGGKSVAVLACDPQSSLTGGALLGDRFRMGSRDDDGVFIRSLAALAGRGAVAERLDLLCRLLEAFGFDVLFLETVGAGQGDIAVRELADVVVLLLQPETGDELQWEKAGVLEVADVVVVHKADLPGAESTIAQVRATLELSRQQVPIVPVSSRTGAGLAELWQKIEAFDLRRPATTPAGALLRLAQDTLAARFRVLNGDPKLSRLVEAWQRGEQTSSDAAAELIEILSKSTNV